MCENISKNEVCGCSPLYSNGYNRLQSNTITGVESWLKDYKSSRKIIILRNGHGRLRSAATADWACAPGANSIKSLSAPFTTAGSLYFLNIGSGMGQILHGSVCLRMQCSVGTNHMPESTAIFTIMIWIGYYFKNCHTRDTKL